MPSDKEKIFEDHIADYLTDKGKHGYLPLSAADCTDKEYHFIVAHLLKSAEEAVRHHHVPASPK